jgi:hypothetical protein
MIGRTATPIPQRMALMQNVTRAVIAYHDANRPLSSPTFSANRR